MRIGLSGGRRTPSYHVLEKWLVVFCVAVESRAIDIVRLAALSRHHKLLIVRASEREVGVGVGDGGTGSISGAVAAGTVVDGDAFAAREMGDGATSKYHTLCKLCGEVRSQQKPTHAKVHDGRYESRYE